MGAAQPPPVAQLSHPPGYQQNTNLTAAREPDPYSVSGGLPGLGSGGLVGGAGNSSGGDSSAMEDMAKLQESAGEAWTAVKGWAGVAGEQLIKAEKRVWEWADGKGS